MDLDKLYYIHQYPVDWKKKWKAHVFKKQIGDLSFQKLAGIKREFVGEFDHTGDAIRYSTLIRRIGE